MSSVFLLALSDNPSSKQSRSLAEELGKAVEIMGKGKNGIGFGKVDITVEKELRKEFDVKKAPELKLFFEGNRSQPISCQGNGICVSIKGMLTMETQKSVFQWLNRITSLCLACTEPSCSKVGGGASGPHNLSRTQVPFSLWHCPPLGPLILWLFPLCLARSWCWEAEECHQWGP